jgi:large subunit ribosomal protein L17
VRHRKRVIKLNREPEHRKAIIRNIVRGLFLSGKVETTLARARAARQVAERLITRAKEDTVHNRREVRRFLVDRVLTNKLFADIAPFYRERPGGYTRIIKIGPRRGDCAERVLLSLVGFEKEKK